MQNELLIVISIKAAEHLNMFFHVINMCNMKKTTHCDTFCHYIYQMEVIRKGYSVTH